MSAQKTQRGNWLEEPAPPLALLGGVPAFREKVHVGRPNIGDRRRLFERINTMLDTRYFTNSGPFEREFEERICEMLNVPHCVAMCNATAALELVFRALNLEGEVVVPSFTFVATVHALQWQHITPVFCDIDPATHNIDPDKIESLITPRTSGILAVHLWGRPCPVDKLEAIADANNLALIFDAAHAFGCKYRDRAVGSFGRAEILSFHATKFLSAAEGGAVVTKDAALAERLRLMRNFGFSGYDNVVDIGTNAKMSELSAAIGLTNLESLTEFIRINRANFDAYERGLNGIPGLILIRQEEANSPNYQYVALEVDPPAFGLTRDELSSVLHAENVLARRYFYPGVHRMEPYRTLFPHVGSHLPATQALAERVLVLPTGTGVSIAQVEKICGIICLAAARNREVRAALHQS